MATGPQTQAERRRGDHVPIHPRVTKTFLSFFLIFSGAVEGSA